MDAGAGVALRSAHSIRRNVMRGLLAAALSVLTLITGVPTALAQTAVPRLVKIVVPFAPGASNDVIARAVAPQLAKRLDTTVIVENRPGAAGVIGADVVAKAAKDGSVLLLTSSSFLTAAATQPTLPYDPLAAFTPVAMIGGGPLLVAVSATTPYKTPADVIAAARANPDDLNYGSAGVGSIGHLSTEILDAAAGVKMKHVPYKGASLAVLDLASGQIQVMISNYSTVAPMVKAGKVRPIGVTSKAPHPAFPELPTVASVVPDYAVDIWVGVFAPAGTPTALVERLNRELIEIAKSPELAPILEPDGTVPSTMAPTAFAAQVKDDLALWKKIASDRKIVAE
jgi:tripartite-type tricarboxylate transporter receptor subunit TctC